MKQFIVFPLIIFAFISCSMEPEDGTVAFSVVADSSSTVSRSANYADADTYPEGSISGDLEMTFLAERVEFWSTDWVLENDLTITDPEFHIYSYHIYSQLHQSDPDTYPWNWEADFMGPVSTNVNTVEKYTFESGQVNAVPPVDVLFGSTVYDVIRISFTEMRYSHLSNTINRVYNEVLDEWGTQSFDSIFLMTTITEPYFISSADFVLTFSELESKHGTYYANFVDNNRDNVDMDGAIFLPFEGLDLTSEGVEEAIVTLVWDIDNSIGVKNYTSPDLPPGVTVDGNQFFFNERIVGTGTPFDLTVEENVLEL